jgi:hypothetical protein
MKPAKLGVDHSAPLRRLLAESVERGVFSLGRDDVPDPADAERPDRFVLQVRGAHEEPELLHAVSLQILAQTCSLEMSAERRHLIGIAQPGHGCFGVGTSQITQEVTEVRCTSQRQNCHPLSVKAPTEPGCEHLEGSAVTIALHEHAPELRAGGLNSAHGGCRRGHQSGRHRPTSPRGPIRT